MVTRRAVLTADKLDKTEIVYPESDGMPLADGFYQEEYFLDILPTLKLFFESDPRVVISGNTFIYYLEGDPQSWISPDCYVALDVSMDSIDRYNTYRVWEVGKVPEFILEIGSPSAATNDLGDKRDLYARMGIGEYWLFDPSGGDFYGEPLFGEYLKDGEYERFDMKRESDGMVRGHSPVLNLDLCWNEGRLRFYDPVTRSWLPNMAETNARANSAEARAEYAEARMADMEAELRRLRGE